MNIRWGLQHQVKELCKKVSWLHSIRGDKVIEQIFGTPPHTTTWAPRCNERGAGRDCGFWVGKWRLPEWQKLEARNFWQEIFSRMVPAVLQNSVKCLRGRQEVVTCVQQSLFDDHRLLEEMGSTWLWGEKTTSPTGQATLWGELETKSDRKRWGPTITWGWIGMTSKGCQIVWTGEDF